MNVFWNLILVSFFGTNSLDKAESVQLFEEIFGEGWWDNDKAKEWDNLTLEHNFHHQIDRQNTQIEQIEPNSTDQNPPLTETDHTGQIEPNSTDRNPSLIESDHSGQIQPNSTDQNPSLTESDHSDNAKNGEDQNELTSNAEDERKRKIVDKFLAIKEDFKQKGKYLSKEWTQIENEIAKDLKVNRTKIFEWKKEFGLSQKRHNFGKEKNYRKNLVEKFDQMKAELNRAGFKNSYKHEIDKTVSKKLGLSFGTISNWKRKLGQTTPQHKHSHNEQKELMKRYYVFKDTNPKISDEDIAKKMLKIGSRTLCNWKKHFKRQQFYQNSVDGNAQEIGNSKSGNI